MSPAFDRLEALPDTRKVERPKLESKPMPAAWMPSAKGGFIHRGTGFDASELPRLSDAEICDLRTLLRDALELVDWAIHERAVRAQEGGR